MEEILRSIEALPAVALLRRSFVTYPLLNALHVLSIGAVVTTAALIDLRLLGAFRTLPASVADQVLRPVALAAFAMAVLSGVLLFAVNASEYWFNTAFRVKFALLALAGINFILHHRYLRHHPAGSTAIRLTAVVSLLLWLGVLVAGRFIGFL